MSTVAQTPTPQAQPEATQPAAQTALPRRNIIDLLEIVSETELRKDYAKSLIDAELSRDLFDQDWRLARVFALSGEFAELKDKSAEQAIATAMAKIRLGRSWGLDESDSMRYLYFTNGKPALESDIMAAKMREAGYDWDIQWLEEKGVCTGCILWLKKLDRERGVSVSMLDRDKRPIAVSFSKSDADRALIWEKGKQIPLSEKWNFKAWPRDMYFSRCITRLRRYHCPEVLRGATSRQEAEDEAASGADLGETPEQIAQRKISNLEEQSRSRRGCAPGETEAERDARIDRQIEEQSSTINAMAETKEEPAAEEPDAGDGPKPDAPKLQFGNRGRK